MKDGLIFYEVDVQNDFMNEDGGLYVPGAEEIKPAIGYLAKLAKSNGIRRVRSIDRHFANDDELIANGGPFPNHCMDEQYNEKNVQGNYGVALIPELEAETGAPVWYKMNEQGMTPGFNYSLIKSIVERGGDIVIEKQHYDVFTNPFAEDVLKELETKQAVVYGVATDYCVRAAVVGMQSRGIQTYVVSDAIRGVDLPAGNIDEAMKEMKNAGAKFLKAKDVEAMLR